MQKGAVFGHDFDIVRDAMGLPLLALTDVEIDVDLHVEGVDFFGATDVEDGESNLALAPILLTLFCCSRGPATLLAWWEACKWHACSGVSCMHGPCL